MILNSAGNRFDRERPCNVLNGFFNKIANWPLLFVHLLLFSILWFIQYLRIHNCTYIMNICPKPECILRILSAYFTCPIFILRDYQNVRAIEVIFFIAYGIAKCIHRWRCLIHVLVTLSCHPTYVLDFTIFLSRQQAISSGR